ncbi:MAG: PAS domain S-box protein [Phenylobacterium sp.]|uniref:PAS domain S-box protein n=1 Tax=Phenylobacterium sp. TaxID=1871053 RepID=UPI0011F81E60|nr:PAS domain S-box protein [Phenylobacterium sp.]TAJ72947.1 MAG: PAS domain S-box protein [Phenylobacterium sp.]
MTDRPKKTRSGRNAVESRRRLEGIVASAMDGIITVNDEQRVVLFNPAAERMFGLSAADALGQHISRFMPIRYRETHAAHIQRFAATGVTNRQMGSLGEISGLRADGEEFPIEASISQVQVGGERLSTVILRDITERMVAVDALRESRRRMEGIVESAMDALITVDEQHRIMLFNPAAERMFGVPAAEAIGAPLESFIPERFRAGHAEHIRRFKVAGVTNRRMGALGAVSGLRANGEEFPVEASISQVEVGGERLSTVILRDITERRANEEARHLLAREVDHRAKNALAVVQAVVSLTRAATKEDFVAAVRGRVAALGRAHSLLAQNRWEGGDLAQISTDETTAYHRGGQVRISGPAFLLPPNAVQPVSLLIHELATNAVKYGALSVDSGRVDIDWTILPAGGLELRWIESKGPPVREPAAAGFGSTLVREVTTRQLGGSLDIEWPSSGLRLAATLPLKAYRPDHAAPAAVVDPASPGAVEGRGRGRLLVVEDESLIAMAVCQDLASLGWSIIGPAASVEEARRLLKGIALPDAAVLDVNLAGQSVYPLAEWLQSQQVPFVFCSGYEQLEDHPNYEAWPRVRKPVDIQALDGELRRAREAA